MSELPKPFEFYSRVLGSGVKNGSWINRIHCPFHEDHTPSFGVNIESGGYNCFGCGAKGGSIVHFYARLKGISYRQAAEHIKMGNF